ncbi:MAG: hypothetical protein A3C80_01760 [Candidatus Ryanbacteria bacterium RIFCSPHIGHO2_02_FULL_45_43]|uniref:Uncharacterized protein n=1 Tax=Candidatus Ryanbacteria bacterium RIFCSPHIGHO2_01_45_13 TaxID=1802112 RepID=A0A1G2FYP6_9BACT|nr:MAG: hypothetical protein A2718_02595 [Candidatus Ryanbacteria bacterium RIFCSPHIGHO2_01_FULL_44_130]OGZ42967.1 MAG: hypothetical protein A2W41_02535 [Candidatus Ryanbacteria bacterium RIFCSPHIGHO2_01_45_13]OGZ48672.1 MAG: hypothetical protein A3C80_01760 [Candidatus Ryanbacteria bacterium RIFCSPHIGHO2_02_FULL_45_43]OGZ50612.1 MAG: hypothetical protein A3E55_03240 [Candidatus Ryanbacteria bacterium RIFCSPHIGHO2_12_FULL_44_20]OGZ51918.1 MAG: hypothetical protein A3A17_00615 [Candidatus Ryanba
MIRLLIIFVLVVVLLSLLGVNIVSLLNNKTLRDNFSFIWNWTKHIWITYLKAPVARAAIFIWEEGIKPVFQLLKDRNNASNEGDARIGRTISIT